MANFQNFLSNLSFIGILKGHFCCIFSLLHLDMKNQWYLLLTWWNTP